MSKDVARAVLEMLDKSENPKKTARAIASYLVAERRTSELNSLLRELEELRYKRDGSLEVTATTVRPLSEETKREIRKLFDAQKVVIHEEINENLLGGVKVRALDRAADFSVQTRLRKLRSGAGR